MLLPIFPLKLVVYPNEKNNLHIFEERYKELINDCDKGGMTFGMPVFMNGKMHAYGCELKIEAIQKRYKNGELDITCRGQRIFKCLNIVHPMDGKLYAGAEVAWVSQDMVQDISANINIIEKLYQLYALLKMNRTIPEDPADVWSFDIAHHIGFSTNQEYQLLMMDSEKERMDMIDNHLSKIIPTLEEMERLKERVRMNGHFKNILPPNF
jgi:Lon protease-like protein